MTPWSLGGSADDVTCVRCLEAKDPTDVDRHFWCRECRARAVERATARGWMIGGALATLLALWIWLFVRPSTLIIGGWIGAVVAAFWLLSRIAREVHYGVARYRNRRAVEARASGAVGSMGSTGPAGSEAPPDEGGEEGDRE